MPGVPRRRIEDLPYAALILRRLLRASGVNRVVFSANGLREGWFARMMPPEIRAEDPLLAAGRDLTRGILRDADLPPALIAWTNPLFPGRDRGAAAAAGGGVLALRYRQPRTSGISRGAGVSARAAPAGDRAGPPCAGVSGADHGAALRGGAG